MGQRQAVSRLVAVRYRDASLAGKITILDELCAVTEWHRDHARKVLRRALRPEPVGRKRKSSPQVIYGRDVVAALEVCWAVLGGPCGKRLAPFLGEIVDRLRAVGELRIGQHTRDVLVGMSAATIDRRLAGARGRLQLTGRSGTKPGSLLKAQIPVRTWSQWDEDRPGFVEIDLVGHEGGNSPGGVLPDVDGDGYRHWLDRDPGGAQQGRCASGSGVGRYRRGPAVSVAGHRF